jgi:hypothetical protein
MIRAVRPLAGSALALLALAAQTAQGQSVLDGELRLAPSFVQYQLHAPADETISELAIPDRD